MIKDYIIKETLGKGSYGVVYKVQRKNTNNIYVIKQISLNGLSTKEINEVNQEGKILSLINSDFVVKYYDCFKEKDNINILMEYCDGGDLNDFLNEKRKIGKLLDENLIWQIFIKITIGLADIHKMKILHRDLKTLNIFLKKNLEIKIGDLGVAKILSRNSFAKTVIGTPYYLSPEICEEKPYNDKSDVWALGCILYELCTFKHPFEAKSQGALILKILNNKPEPIDSRYSSDLNNLIELLLDKEPEKRPTCSEILKNNIVINKVKSLGLYEYIIKLRKSEYNDNFNNNVKISKKVLDSNIVNNVNININKKYYNKHFSKENIYKGNVISNGKNQNNKKQVSELNLLEQIKNNNLKFNNINHQVIHKKKNSEVKINVLALGELKDQKALPSAHLNKKPILKYNNFFISNINDKKDRNEKVLISKKNNNNIYNQNNSNIQGKKINIIHPVKIIFKNSNESNNKLNEDKIKNKNNIKEEKKIIKDNYMKKYIPKYKFNQKENKNIEPFINIKHISGKDLRLENHKEINDIINKAKIDKPKTASNINDNKEKEKKPILNNYKINNINLENKSDDNKIKVISLLPKKNKIKICDLNSNDEKEDNNNNKKNEININDKNKENKNNDSVNENEDSLIFNEKIISSDFEVVDNNEQNLVNSDNNTKDIDSLQNIQITNENEDSIDDDILIKSTEKDLNKKINIMDSDNENSEENEEENVKEIKVNINKAINGNGVKIESENKNEKLKKEIFELKDKIKECKNEMLKLIGEKDYKYVMDLYDNRIKEQNKIDEIYKKIEDFANKNYFIEKKEQFNNCYFRLVSLECQLGKKSED